MNEKKAILISGSSGGIGSAIVNKFLSEGYVVFGLDIKEPKDKHENLHFISTNLRKEEDVLKAFEEVKESGYRLTTIISAAGIVDLNSLIEMSEEDFIKILDINATSSFRINKIFLPLLEENSKIIIITSELGPLDPLPFNGIYTISKALLEKYAYALRMELQLLGHQVIVVRPGAVDTEMINVSNQKLDSFVNQTEIYKYNSRRFKDIVDKVQSRVIPPAKVANLIYKINNKKKPHYVYKINRNVGLILLNLLPHRLQNWIIKQILKAK